MKLEFIFKKKGFVADYWYWTYHEENGPTLHRVFINQASSSTTVESRNNEDLNRFQAMVYDVVGPNFGMHCNQEVEKPPNANAKNLCGMHFVRSGKVKVSKRRIDKQN